ncbi:unnamed protein product [Paramecium octaurelia]|uniref:Alpha-tubulin n=1 Tax=Paramecium octaurelia TaxID=43137 RepID=A0A8S1WEZ7_PAROT|nr:unnamed protein product [Paramecium octaurelia]
MREVITIQVGQGGIQVGNACWELFCLEHQIQLNGQLINQQIIDKNDALRTLFFESDLQKLVPRSILLDLESSIIDEVKTGKFKEMFNPEQLISGKGGTAHNFGRGYYSIGQEYIDTVYVWREQENLLKIVLHFKDLQYSIRLVEGQVQVLVLCYLINYQLGIIIYPSPETQVSMVEPYNSILATQSLIDHADVCITMDNQAIYDICKNKLDVEVPKYSNLNRMIAQVMSSITASMRYDGPLLREMAELENSLVPYAKFKFLICTYAPIISYQKLDHLQLSTIEISKLAFETTNMMAKCDPRLGKYMSCCLLYRGDIIPKDVSYSISQIKTQKTIRFVDWCPTGLKVGIDYQVQQTLPEDDIRKAQRSACMIGNTTAVSQVFSELCHKYDSMFSKRAFVHWYIKEGMEEAQFVEAREELACLLIDYEEADSEINEGNYEENAGP